MRKLFAGVAIFLSLWVLPGQPANACSEEGVGGDTCIGGVPCCLPEPDETDLV